MPALRQGEAGASGLPCRQSVLHEAVCLLSRPALSRQHDQDVAEEIALGRHSIKELDKEYMRVQLARTGVPGPKAIGIDEISIRKGYTYRILVSDLIRHRPIWFGGEDRSEASMEQFYDWLGEK